MFSSPGWWHEGEFLHHLVGDKSGRLPNDIRVRVVLFRSSVGLCMNVLKCMVFMLIDMSDAYECFA